MGVLSAKWLLLAQQAAAEGHKVELIDSVTGVVARMIQHRNDIEVKVYDGRNRIQLKNSIVVTKLVIYFGCHACLTWRVVRHDFGSCTLLIYPTCTPLQTTCGLWGKILKNTLFRSYRKSLVSVGRSLYFQSEDTRKRSRNSTILGCLKIIQACCLKIVL